jgi:hypothetical protein
MKPYRLVSTPSGWYRVHLRDRTNKLIGFVYVQGYPLVWAAKDADYRTLGDARLRAEAAALVYQAHVERSKT